MYIFPYPSEFPPLLGLYLVTFALDLIYIYYLSADKIFHKVDICFHVPSEKCKDLHRFCSKCANCWICLGQWATSAGVRRTNERRGLLVAWLHHRSRAPVTLRPSVEPEPAAAGRQWQRCWESWARRVTGAATVSDQPSVTTGSVTAWQCDQCDTLSSTTALVKY